MTDSSHRGLTGFEIAIVGMAGRFPRAHDVETFWRNLAEGAHCISFFTDEELVAAGVDQRMIDEPNYVKAGGVLEDAELFDAASFGYSAHEAEVIDPQQRVLLECAREALESAGYGGKSDDLVGVYAGVTRNTYLNNLLADPEVIQRVGGFQIAISSDKDFLAPRISYKLNLRGPSVVVQTACSTSLVAVHMACQALLAGECRTALAGGVSITFPQVSGYFFQQNGINSPDGTCRAFDARSQGTVPGRGAGMVVLKTLEDALADGDFVRAVIKGSAANNDGSFKVGFTAPGLEGQAQVIRAALGVAEVDPETIGYVEAHGTGTELGDPIEVAALTRAFQTTTAKKQFCALASLKSNIGHLDAAAGVAGLIKTVLALEHRQLPASLHFTRPNPKIDFSNSPFYVNDHLAEWPSNGNPRRAGVSSFGIGGTNAHVILEEAPEQDPSGPSRRWQMLSLSAMTAAALEQATDNLAAHLREHPEQPLADVAFTLQTGRQVLSHRRILLSRDAADAASALAERDQRRLLTFRGPTGGHSVVFLFPGQGTQHVGMGRELFDTEPTFRHWIDDCSEKLRPHLGQDLRELLYPPADRIDEAQRELAQTALAQPALFTVEVALAQLWSEWGIRPHAMIGHSLGELVAAFLAGVLSLDDALALVVIRGRLMQSVAGGAMVALRLPEDEAAAMLEGGLALAAVNGPAMTVVSGPVGEIEAFEGGLADQGIVARRLHTSHAFHSPMMEPILEFFAEQVRRISLAAPEVPFVSNLTGDWIRPEEATDPSYWVRQIRQTVRFGEGLATLCSEPSRVFLEVGPGTTLTRLAGAHPAKTPEQVVVAAMRPSGDRAEDGSDVLNLLGALGRLWLAGVPVDWPGFYRRERRRRWPLPTYPFERRRYWVEGQSAILGEDASPLATEVGTEASTEAEPAAVGEEAAPAGRRYHPRPELLVAFTAPRGEVEERLAELWQDLLGIAPVGVEDNFFELGGHSLLATQLVAELRRTFKVEFPLRDIFDTPTVATLAGAVAERRARGEAEPEVELPTLVPDLVNRHRPFPLTDVQQAYWIGRSGAFDLGQVATHSYLEIEGDRLDPQRFERAWHRLIDRHDMLRAVVHADGRQRILEQVPRYRIAMIDFRGLAREAVEGELQALRHDMSHQVLAADHWPLFDLKASFLPAGRVRIHFSFDLLIGDGWSWRIMLFELFTFYRQPDLELEPPELSFRDYVLGEIELQRTPIYDRAASYWLERLDSLPPAPELPLAKSLGEIERPRFRRRSYALPAARWRRLTKRAITAGMTPSGLLLAAFSEALATWSKSPRFTINLTLFNRLPMHPEVHLLIGDFTSLTLLEVDASVPAPFEERAKRLQRQFLDDLDHRYMSAVRVLREVNRRQGGAAPPIMPVVFTSTLALDDAKTGDEEELPFAGMGEPVFSISQTPQVLIDHQVGQQAGGLVFNWDAVDEAFPPGLLDDMFASYCALLDRLADDEATWRSAHLDLLPATQGEERAAVNVTTAPLTSELLHTPFARQAAEQPEHPAVVWTDGELTYGELDRRANRLARRLRQLGARPEKLVAVVLEKGWEQIVAVLAILRSGAAYLPIDPGLPDERRHYLLEHGEAEIAVTHSAAGQEWPPGVHPVTIDDPVLEALDDGVLEVVQKPEDLAYVIFTSGSTGLPKGVMIEHRGAVNTISDVNHRFGVGPDDRVLALSALNFDLSVWDIFGALAAGATVVMPDADKLRDPRHWAALARSAGVSLWDSVPALMQMQIEELEARGERLPESLRLVLLSGDWIPVDLPDRIRRLGDGIEVVSLGGATEASIWSILHPIAKVDPAWPSIPYGRPMINQTFHVLDRHLEPRPVWVPGELYIGGVGLARGYWKDTAKTSASFLVHPRTGERLYRTGDLGRYLPGGDLEFLGREDFQVKVQGYRIELGEIEVALTQHPAVRSAVVMARGPRQGNKHLVGYVVFAEAGEVEVEELRRFLGGKLPDYMVPPIFVPLAVLPLTANGKVDRKALPALGGERDAAAAPENGRRGVAPRDRLELELSQIWGEVLGRAGVTIHDNFFELGGHSLLAVRLMSAIEHRLGEALPIATLFQRPTVEAMAALLREQHRDLPTAALVALTPREPASKPPFFWVHPVGGNVFCYFGLARALGRTQPCFAFQSKVRAAEGVATLEAMASEYCAELQRAQPHGPYFLGGWSMGGVVAFEMAQQLSAAGEKIAHLALFDARAPGRRREMPREEALSTLFAFARDLGIPVESHELSPGEMVELEPTERLTYLLGRAQAAGILPSDETPERIHRLFEVFEHNSRVLASYRGKPYQGRITLFRAAEGPAPSEASMGWERLAKGVEVEVEVVGGHHYSLLDADHAEDLADRLRQSVERAKTAQR